ASATGAGWEGAIITQELYDSGARNSKFLPVIFSDGDASHIPMALRPFAYFRVDTLDGYLALRSRIVGVLQVALAPLVVIGESAILSSHALRTWPRLEIHNHAIVRSNLPRLAYFFGRELELATIASSLEPGARTWRSLIDGPGGIGKTALAVRAAE